MWLEKKGIPTVTVVTAPFREPARLTAMALGVPNLPLIVLPHPVGDLAESQVRALAEAAYPQIEQVLTQAAGGTRDFWVDFKLPTGLANPADCEVCIE